jgi:hypothetical protein
MTTIREFVYGRHYKALQRAYAAHQEMDAQLTLAEVLTKFHDDLEKRKESDAFFEVGELADEGSTVRLFNDFISHRLGLRD